MVAYARLAVLGNPTHSVAEMSIDSLGSNLLGRSVAGMTNLDAVPSKERPTSAIVMGKALRFITSMVGEPPRSESLLLDRTPRPARTLSLGTTFNRTRRCHKLCAKFQTPSPAPIIAVTMVKLTIIRPILSPLLILFKTGVSCPIYRKRNWITKRGVWLFLRDRPWCVRRGASRPGGSVRHGHPERSA